MLIQNKLSESFKQNQQRIAIEYGNRRILYSELDFQSDIIACQIRKSGMKEHSNIGLLLNGRDKIIVAIVGILKAGCVFVPLDPAFPKRRLEENINTAELTACIVEASTKESIDALNIQQFKKLEYDMLLKNENIVNGEVAIMEEAYQPDDMIYLYFTSGTTGAAKAVAGRNKGLTHYVNWEIDTFGLNERVRVSQLTSPCHDPFLRDVFVPLFTGGTVCIPVSKETIISPMALSDWINRTEIQVVHCTPSVFQMIRANISLKDYQKLQYVFLAGEKVLPEYVEEWFSVFGERISLINLYGPTETTLAKLYHIITPEDVKAGIIPIGKAITGAKAILLNKELKPSIQGEIYIRTPYRTLGYYKDEELNRKKFIQNPFSEKEDDLIYATGDMGKLLDNGEIVFLRRQDNQVKIRGFRVELSEIENQLLKMEQVNNCVVQYVHQGHTQKEHYCKKCGMPSSYPRVEIDTDGVCSFCREYEEKKDTYQSFFRRKEELEAVFTRNEENKYDCLLLFSGGKDSTYVLYRLVEMGIKVLAYSFDNGFISETAIDNIKRVTQKLNVDCVIENYKDMKQLFKTGIEVEKSVCNGCFRVLRTLSTRYAYENKIPYIVTGFSRGQLLELRFQDLMDANVRENQKIDQRLKEQRLIYHKKKDYIYDLLHEDEKISDEMIDKTQLIDFYRYVDVKKSDILEYLKKMDVRWEVPEDTGTFSSNCLINDVGIYIQRTELGYDNYTGPNCWEVRLGHLTYEEEEQEKREKIDPVKTKALMDEIGYQLENTSVYNDGILKAYIVEKEPVKQEECYDYLAEYLPEYMLPSRFVKIQKIPLTLNGKVDYAALERQAVLEQEQLKLPETRTQRMLAQIWMDILNLDKVGIDKDFMKIGGHSLNVMTLITEIKKKCGIEVSLGTVFKNSSIEKMAAYLDAQKVDNTIEAEGHGKLSRKTEKAAEVYKAAGVVGEIKGIEPFNDVFFINCFYSALFSVVQYYGQNIMDYLLNHITAYQYHEDKPALKFDVDFLESGSLLDTLKKHEITVEKKMPEGSVLQEIFKDIDKQNPVIIGVDCYYLSIRKDTYNKNHWPHSILIYGYSLEKKTFFAIEQRRINTLTYEKKEIPFEDIQTAYGAYVENYNNGKLYAPAYVSISGKRRETVVEQDRKSYSARYIETILQKKTELQERIQSLSLCCKNLLEIVDNQEMLSETVTNLLYVINNIVNGKLVERYKLKELYGEEDEKVALVDSMIHDWKVIRAYLERYQITGILFEKPLKEAVMGIYEIEEKEQSLIELSISMIS